MKLDFDSCDDEEVNNTSLNTYSSGCDVDDGGELSDENSNVGIHPAAAASAPPHSPRVFHSVFSPRKVTRASSSVSGMLRGECEVSPQAMMVVNSPPYKKIRALRLFDSPATPKTLLQKCTTAESSSSSSGGRAQLRSRLFLARQKTLLSTSNQCTPSSTPQQQHHHQQQKGEEGKCTTKEVANINPFTPTGMLLSSRKRTRSRKKTTLSG